MEERTRWDPGGYLEESGLYDSISRHLHAPTTETHPKSRSHVKRSLGRTSPH